MGAQYGGGITLRVVVVDQEVTAAVLYGSMSGDERQNYERVLLWSGGERGREELAAPEEALQRISPAYHLDRVRAALSIHHGEADDVVPPEWSAELCEQLEAAGKSVECFTYPGQPHTFYGEGDRLFMERVVAFFNSHLRSSGSGL